MWLPPIIKFQQLPHFLDSQKVPQNCPRHLQDFDEGNRLEGGVHHHKVQRPQPDARGKYVKDKRFIEEGTCLVRDFY
jgi:hypothetical protein